MKNNWKKIVLKNSLLSLFDDRRATKKCIQKLISDRPSALRTQPALRVWEFSERNKVKIHRKYSLYCITQKTRLKIENWFFSSFVREIFISGRQGEECLGLNNIGVSRLSFMPVCSPMTMTGSASRRQYTTWNYLIDLSTFPSFDDRERAIIGAI